LELELLGKEPIQEGQPTGSDVRYDPVFEELQAEMGKLSSPLGISAMDWRKVVSLASEILNQKSKDLLVASYLAVALIYTHQAEGWGIGLKIYFDLLDQFWDSLYPGKSRMRARLSAIEWWLERTEMALKQLQPNALSPEQQQGFKENLEKIDQFLSDHLDEAPSFRPLYEGLASLSMPSEEPIPAEIPLQVISEGKEKEISAKEPEKPSEEEKESEIPEGISSPGEAQRIFTFGLEKIRKAATFLWEQDLSNPLPYRLIREALWSTVEELPPTTDGLTQIPPPPAQIKNVLSEQKNKRDYESLLRSAEESLPEFIFWMDLNRFVSEALTSMGDSYQRAKDVVCQETGYLMHRLPGLEGLSFSDGTPFADPETKEWLKEIGFKAGVLSEPLIIPLATPTPGQEEDLIEKEMREAQALVKGGKLLEAVQKLQQRVHQSLSQRERLLWRLALSQLLLRTKQSKLALPHFEQILKDIDFYKLEEYDPLLALTCLKVVWVGLTSQSDKTWKAKSTELLHRIAKLDLTEAIRMGKT
jgi:type VI secretion system protein VasJ